MIATRLLLLLPIIITLLPSLITATTTTTDDCPVETTPIITKNQLLSCINVENAISHLNALQTIADDNNAIRTSGSTGYSSSIEYVSRRLISSGFYDVIIQPLQLSSTVTIAPPLLENVKKSTILRNIEDYMVAATVGGDVRRNVTFVDLALGSDRYPNDPSSSTSGCDEEDYVDFIEGTIALVQRGGCSLTVKAEMAALFGAAGVIIMNQGDDYHGRGSIYERLDDDYNGGVMVFTTSFDRGYEWAEDDDGDNLVLHMAAHFSKKNPLTYNIIATSRVGDSKNVVMMGAHLDSEPGSPGINDNGSGVAALLEVADKMARVENRRIKNKLRFAFWGAEELGRLGSNFYLDNTTDDAALLDDIALYMNFDMLASRNYVRFVYDGDGSTFGKKFAGPPGSGAIETLFQNFFADRGLETEPIWATLSTDQKGFMERGVPVGGLYTGGGYRLKTEEEERVYGGTAGEPYDPCYHKACDTIDMINVDVFDVNLRAIAFATFRYAVSTDSVTNGKNDSAAADDDDDDASNKNNNSKNNNKPKLRKNKKKKKATAANGNRS